MLAVLLFCFLLGLSLEFVQPLTGRLSEARDVIVNSAGMILGLIAAACFRGVAVAINRNQNQAAIPDSR